MCKYTYIGACIVTWFILCSEWLGTRKCIIHFLHFILKYTIRKYKKTKRDLLGCWTQKCNSWEDRCRVQNLFSFRLLSKNVQSVLQSYFTHCVVGRKRCEAEGGCIMRCCILCILNMMIYYIYYGGGWARIQYCVSLLCRSSENELGTESFRCSTTI